MKRFKSLRQLGWHTRTCTETTDAINCPYCTVASFFSPRQLTRHIESSHPDQLKSLCQNDPSNGTLIDHGTSDFASCEAASANCDASIEQLEDHIERSESHPPKYTKTTNRKNVTMEDKFGSYLNNINSIPFVQFNDSDSDLYSTASITSEKQANIRFQTNTIGSINELGKDDFMQALQKFQYMQQDKLSLYCHLAVLWKHHNWLKLLHSRQNRKYHDRLEYCWMDHLDKKI